MIRYPFPVSEVSARIDHCCRCPAFQTIHTNYHGAKWPAAATAVAAAPEHRHEIREQRGDPLEPSRFDGGTNRTAPDTGDFQFGKIYKLNFVFCLIYFKPLFPWVQFDRDRNGYLDISEMKRLIRSQQCDVLPKGIARKILERHDANEDGRLDFEEFYALSQEHTWLFKGLVVRYCKMLVPSPHREEFDQTGRYKRFK